MSTDLQRLCEAVDREVRQSGYSSVGVVRAVLTELREGSEDMERAALEAGGMTDDGEDKRASVAVEFTAMIDHLLIEPATV